MPLIHEVRADGHVSVSLVCAQCGITIEDRTYINGPRTKNPNGCAAAMMWTPFPELGFDDDGNALGEVWTLTFFDGTSGCCNCLCISGRINDCGKRYNEVACVYCQQRKKKLAVAFAMGTHERLGSGAGGGGEGQGCLYSEMPADLVKKVLEHCGWRAEELGEGGSAPRAHWDPALFTPKEYNFEEANVRLAFQVACQERTQTLVAEGMWYPHSIVQDKSELGTNVFQTSWHAKLQFNHSQDHQDHHNMILPQMLEREREGERGVYGHDRKSLMMDIEFHIQVRSIAR